MFKPWQRVRGVPMVVETFEKERCRFPLQDDMNASAKQQLKRRLPKWTWTCLRCAVAYVQRLRCWFTVIKEVRGRTGVDSIKLLISALASPLTSLRDLNGWQDPVLLFDTSVLVSGIDRFHLRRRTDDLYHVLPSREPEIYALLEQRLHLGATFVDAGANIGVFTVLAARLVGEQGKVVAVEMTPDTAQILRQHIRLNHLENVTVIEGAISSEAGLTIEATVQAGKFGQASIVVESSGVGMRSFRVTTTTLDVVCSDLPAVDLIKMDLEGAEEMALVGGSATLARTKAVIFETVFNGADGAGELLEKSGFLISPVNGSNRLAARPSPARPN